MTVTDPAWASFPRVRRLIAGGIGRHHPGAQVHVAVGGQPVLEEAIGDDGHGRPLTSDHRMAWLSAGKPLTAVVALRLVERGLFRLEDRVAEYIPEFASGGKDEVTLRQLLTHTAGIQPVPTGWPRLTWGSIVERVCNAKLRHGAIPGETPAYDPQRTWFILGELLQRAVGADFEADMASELCGPLGMERSRWTVTADASEWQSLTHECDGETCRPARDQMTPEACPAPGSSLLAPAGELGRFYEMLRRGGELDGTRVLSPELVEQMTSRQRSGMFDITFQHVVDFGLGVIVDSNRYGIETVPYGFGRHCSPQTFGHGGAECAIAFADPEHELVVALAFNGRPGEEVHQVRNREICSAIYEDLGLA